MMYDTPPRAAFVSKPPSFGDVAQLLTLVKKSRRTDAAETIVASSGHSFDNALTLRASEKDRRETKETGKERGNGLTRFTALD